MHALDDLVRRAQAADFEAYGRVVEATQRMTYGVALGVLRDPALAQDAAQEAYLRAYRRLGELQDPAAFVSWLRRIIITVALNMRRARRFTLLSFDDVTFTAGIGVMLLLRRTRRGGRSAKRTGSS